ncbi:MAG: hypothetical protein ABEL76_10020, partial [Bradymonadaceae bacterium]
MDEDALKRQVESVADEDPATPIDAPRTRHAARIRRLSRESPQYLALEVELSPRLEGTHRRPGQYVTLAPTGTDPRFLVIASAPTDDASPTWEFLVDVETGLGRALADADRGDELEVSLPEGSGYPVETVADQHVLCFVTGSGIASIRPTIEHWNRHPDAAPSQITL